MVGSGSATGVLGLELGIGHQANAEHEVHDPEQMHETPRSS